MPSAPPKNELPTMILEIIEPKPSVAIARTMIGAEPGGSASDGRQLRTVPTVVAAADINFGEKLTPDKLKLVQWPADNVPAGSFQRIEDLISGQGRTAMRPIVTNEIHGRQGARMMGYYLVNTVLAMIFGLVLSNAIRPGA